MHQPSATKTSPALVARAVAALTGPSVHVSKIEAAQSDRPGLYAVYGSAATWKDLGLGAAFVTGLLYVGKAEDSFASRDVAGHFGIGDRGSQSPTGSSTLRRSLAALLAHERGYVGVPRNPEKPGYFANYGLLDEHDADLSAWMRRRLTLALWPHDRVAELAQIETDVLHVLVPPLNLNKVETPWRTQIKAARNVLADQARAWGPGEAGAGGEA